MQRRIGCHLVVGPGQATGTSALLAGWTGPRSCHRKAVQTLGIALRRSVASSSVPTTPESGMPDRQRITTQRSSPDICLVWCLSLMSRPYMHTRFGMPRLRDLGIRVRSVRLIERCGSRAFAPTPPGVKAGRMTGGASRTAGLLDSGATDEELLPFDQPHLKWPCFGLESRPWLRMRSYWIYPKDRSCSSVSGSTSRASPPTGDTISCSAEYVVAYFFASFRPIALVRKSRMNSLK